MYNKYNRSRLNYDVSDTINNNHSKTIRISHETYVKLKEHSTKYIDQSVSYDEIFQEL